MSSLFIGNSGAISYKHIDGLQYYSLWPSEVKAQMSKMIQYEEDHPNWQNEREWHLCEDENFKNGGKK